MPLLRLEAVQDPKTQKYFLEIFYPADTTAPFVTTEPRYETAAAAENDAIACMAAGANSFARER